MNCKPYIRAHADELLESLAALVRIPSVEGVPEEHAPFGREPARALHETLALCEKLGFRTGNMDDRVGDTAHALCILLSGGVNIERCDAWGHKTLLDRITPGSVFAETYACVPGTPMMVSAVADEPSEVLFLPSETLLSSAAQDSAHSVLLRNLLDVTAQKNLLLTRKIFHTSPKSMRGKLLSYLSAQAVQHGSDTFDIPFDRQQLADYLGVDRSALSAELSRMQRDGLIAYKKSHFVLNHSQSDE